jgi:ribonuclease Y
MTVFEMIGVALLAAAAGGGLAYLALSRTRRAQADAKRDGALAEAARLEEQARREADSIRKEAEIQAKDIVLQARTESERQARQHERDLSAIEKRASQRDEALARKLDLLTAREEEWTRKMGALDAREKQVEERDREATSLLEVMRSKLEEIAGLTRDEAKRTLMDQMLDEARHDAAKQIRQVESEAREESDRRAKKIVSIAIERLAGEFVAERTVSVVALPSDDMKGRIIGREGRNIRAIEAATGVDLIIDDTPEVVVISCHNPIRRELARLSLERLMTDGRIHPGRIEEVVRKAEQELDSTIRDAGQRAVIELGLHGVHPELIRLVGMLKYRYSYAQNVLMHSMECAYIAGALAGELGLNVKHARRAGLLHDIGKALTHEVEGSHAVLGGEIARKYGESAKVVNAIAAHHEEVKAETILAPLVDAADALSGARPGARREVLESYAKRLEELEAISNSFRGVQKSFAVQAGREVRIIVDPGTIPDEQAGLLARDIAKRIESEMTYPGQIKVTVIRETRASHVAH